MSTDKRYPITVNAPIAGATTLRFYADDGVTAISVFDAATGGSAVTQPIAIAAAASTTVYSVERTMQVSCIIGGVEMANGYGLKRSITSNAPVSINPSLPPGVGSSGGAASTTKTGPGGVAGAVTGASTSWDISLAEWFDCVPNGATCTLTISGWPAAPTTGAILLRPTSSGTLTIAVSGGTVVPSTFAYVSGTNALLTVSSDDTGVTVFVGVPLANTGSVATDTVWAAKGDLVVGTANDAAAVLTVGTNGQVLKANSGTATGLEWGAAAGSVATDAIFDAKGDLAVGTGADTAAKLTVGSSGKILIPYSAASTGLLWAPLMQPLASGYYVTNPYGAGNTNMTMTANSMWFCPIFIPNAVTADRISMVVNTVGSAGSVCRLGIYDADATTHGPGALILDAGTIATDSGTGMKEITISQALTPGVKWLAAVAQTASFVIRRFANGQCIPGIFGQWGASNLVLQTPGSQNWVQTSVSGALPNPAVPAFEGNTNNQPIIGLRIA